MGIAFIGVASVIKPQPRGASASTGTVPGPATRPERFSAGGAMVADGQTVHPKGWKLLGMLEGREHLVKCWAAADGPRYSVYTLDGRLVQDDLPADEVYRGFPDIDLINLRADPPGASPSGLRDANVRAGGLVDFVDVWRE